MRACDRRVGPARTDKPGDPCFSLARSNPNRMARSWFPFSISLHSFDLWLAVILNKCGIRKTGSSINPNSIRVPITLETQGNCGQEAGKDVFKD